MNHNYANGFFLETTLHPPTFRFFCDLTEIPDSCDSVAYTCWAQNYYEVANYLLPKTKKLFLALPEPVSKIFTEFVKDFSTNENIIMFGNASLNFDAPNYHVMPNWFIDPRNPYNKETWARQLLQNLTHSTDVPKKFDCLLGREKEHRNLISHLYHASTYKDQIIFTYFRDNMSAGTWDLDPQGKRFTGEFIDYQGQKARLSSILPVSIYNQSVYSIVAETTCLNSHTLYRKNCETHYST